MNAVATLPAETPPTVTGPRIFDPLEGHRPTGQPSEARRWPAPLAEAAFHGLAGEVVRRIAPETESDPAALLFQFLACFGNAVGPEPHYLQERTRHTARQFIALVGKSAKARKGTSWDIIKAIYELADPAWFRQCRASGLGSGEGLVNRVRDPRETTDKDGNPAKIEGATDKRLLVNEGELASVLSVAGREGSTLSEVLRNAWDSGELQILVRNDPVRATGAHVSVIGHITVEELKRRLDNNDLFNGFANRFLWPLVKRARLLPEGGNLCDGDFAFMGEQVAKAIERARTLGRITRDSAAAELWRAEYPRLSDDRPGRFGAVTSRAEAQVLRLSLSYALLDGSAEIQIHHLRAALECWRYCQDSALYIWGEKLDNATAETLRNALAQAGAAGLTRTDISARLHGHTDAKALDDALETLRGYGMVDSETDRRPGTGRKATRYRLVARFAE